jgi:hypothetical protein
MISWGPISSAMKNLEYVSEARISSMLSGLRKCSTQSS